MKSTRKRKPFKKKSRKANKMKKRRTCSKKTRKGGTNDADEFNVWKHYRPLPRTDEWIEENCYNFPCEDIYYNIKEFEKLTNSNYQYDNMINKRLIQVKEINKLYREHINFYIKSYNHIQNISAILTIYDLLINYIGIIYIKVYNIQKIYSRRNYYYYLIFKYSISLINNIINNEPCEINKYDVAIYKNFDEVRERLDIKNLNKENINGIIKFIIEFIINNINIDINDTIEEKEKKYIDDKPNPPTNTFDAYKNVLIDWFDGVINSKWILNYLRDTTVFSNVDRAYRQRQVETYTKNYYISLYDNINKDMNEARTSLIIMDEDKKQAVEKAKEEDRERERERERVASEREAAEREAATVREAEVRAAAARAVEEEAEAEAINQLKEFANKELNENNNYDDQDGLDTLYKDLLKIINNETKKKTLISLVEKYYKYDPVTDFNIKKVLEGLILPAEPPPPPSSNAAEEGEGEGEGERKGDLQRWPKLNKVMKAFRRGRG